MSYPIHPAQHSQAHPLGVLVPNSLHVLVGQVSSIVLRANQLFRNIVPIFGSHIRQVLSLGSLEEMTRIYTGGVIACVANNYPYWDVSIREMPSQSRCYPPLAIDPNLPVSVIEAEFPQPALDMGLFIDVRPELLCDLRLGKHPTTVT